MGDEVPTWDEVLEPSGSETWSLRARYRIYERCEAWAYL